MSKSAHKIGTFLAEGCTATHEEWRPVVGYEGIYAVSDQGRVRGEVGRGRYKAGRILAPRKAQSGHLRVLLSKDGIAKEKWIHRLVMEAFIGPRPEDCVVAHGNGKPFDNRLENLRYATLSENALDCHKYGGKVPNQKLSLRDVAEIRRHLRNGKGIWDIAKFYGVSERTVYSIRSGERWGHRLDQKKVVK